MNNWILPYFFAIVITIELTTIASQLLYWGISNLIEKWRNNKYKSFLSFREYIKG